MKPKLFLILLFCKLQLICQTDISSFVKLDTIITSGIKIDYSDVYPDDIKMKIYKDHLWLFYPSWNDDDTIHLKKINLKSYIKEDVKLYLPSYSFKTSNPNISSFDINDSAIVFMFTTNSFAYFNLKDRKFAFSFMEPLSHSYQNIHLLQNQKVLLSNFYNSHPLDNPDAVVLRLYDCQHKKLIKTLKPEFNSIEFSHFAPNNWLAVQYNKILISQTVNYQGEILDLNLNKLSHYEFKEKDWNYADTIYIKGLSSVSPRMSAKTMIDKLSPIEDSVSRVEAVYLIAENKILVRKIPNNNKNLDRKRLYDILEFKNNKWIMLRENISDKRFVDSESYNKQTFKSEALYGKNLFSGNYFVKASVRFHNYSPGKTYSEMKKNEEKALGKTEPELFIQIFKTDFNVN